MARFLWVVAITVVVAAVTLPAHGQELLDFRQVILCKALREDAARLQCFDRALRNAPSALVNDFKLVEVDSDWQISEGRSPTDDLPRLAAVLPAVEGSAALVLRCRDRVTEVYFSMRTYVGGVEPLPITFRFNDAAPTETRWIPSREGGALFAGTPTLAIVFARTLPDDATLNVKVRDFQNHSTDLTFKLGPVSDIRSRIAEACRWPEPPSAPAAAAPPPQAAPQTPVKVVKHRHVPAQQQRWNVNTQR
jgi:hypothetical protein